MLNLLNPYPTPETVAQLPEVFQFVFTPQPPTAQDIVLEKIHRARELRASFFAKVKVAQRMAFCGQPQPKEYHQKYFAAYQRADRLVTQLRHRL